MMLSLTFRRLHNYLYFDCHHKFYHDHRCYLRSSALSPEIPMQANENEVQCIQTALHSVIHKMLRAVMWIYYFRNEL